MDNAIYVIGLSISSTFFIIFGIIKATIQDVDALLYVFTNGGKENASSSISPTLYKRGVFQISLLKQFSVILSFSFGFILVAGFTNFWWAWKLLILALIVLTLIIFQLLIYLLTHFIASKIIKPSWIIVKSLVWIFGGMFLLIDRLPDTMKSRISYYNSQLTLAMESGEEEWKDAETLLVEEEVKDANPEEQKMIRGVLELEDISVKEIMIPRVDITAVEYSISLEDLIVIMTKEGHSRIPIYKETIDNIVGIIHARDVLQVFTGEIKNEDALKELIRPHLVIPESKPAAETLNELKEKMISIAIVVDEYGGTEGLITVEDIMEEIVGEIEDEFHQSAAAIIKIGDNELIAEGKASLEDINDKLDTELSGDGFNTIGGLVVSSLGKIAKAGDVAFVDDITIRVISTVGRRINRVNILKSDTE